MGHIDRRTLLAASTIILAAGVTRKLHAAGAPDLSGFQPGAPAAPPDFHFVLPDGTERHLSDYAGQGVVLNFWATWCIPCVAEMPALDEAARALAANRIAVLPLSSDRGGAKAVERFYAERGITTLPILLDPRGEAARAFAAKGIPTTVLIDRAGQDRGRMEGAVDWASEGSLKALRALFG